MKTVILTITLNTYLTKLSFKQPQSFNLNIININKYKIIDRRKIKRFILKSKSKKTNASI